MNGFASENLDLLAMYWGGIKHRKSALLAMLLVLWCCEDWTIFVEFLAHSASMPLPYYFTSVVLVWNTTRI